LQKERSFFPSRAAIAERIVDKTRFFSRSHNAVIRVYDEAGNVIETHEHNAISASFEFGRPFSKGRKRIAAHQVLALRDTNQLEEQ
jgi:hypothetical protein